MTEETKPTYVIDPSGQAVKYEGEAGARYASDAGMKRVSEAQASRMAQGQLAQEAMEARYSPAERAALGAFSGATLGVGPALSAELAGLYDKDAATLAKQDLAAMQGSGYHMAGEAAGVIIPSLFGAGPLEMAGSASERLAARVLPEATGVLGKAASGAVRMAARGSAEGALMGLGQAVGQGIIHDKKLGAEALAMGAAEGALFGGLAGGAIGGVGGLVGGGVDALAGGMARGAGEGGVTRAQAIVAKRFGAGADDIRQMLEQEGGKGIGKSLDGFHDILAKAGESEAARTGRVVEVAKAAVKEAEGVQAGVLSTLGREAPAVTPSINRIRGRMMDEVVGPQYGTLMESEYARAADDVFQRISATRPTVNASAWENWGKARQQLSQNLGEGIVKEVRTKTLNILDDEMRASMEEAAASIGKKGLAESYAAAGVTRSYAAHLAEMTEKKLIGEIQQAHGVLKPIDLAQAGGTLAWGNPAWALGMLGAKVVTRKFEGMIEPKIAEIAYRMSVGSKAAKATVDMQGRIQKAVKGFFDNSRREASYANAKSFNTPKTRKEYEARLEEVHNLMSPSHQQRVQDYAKQLSNAGQDELAKYVLETNQRAVQYIQANAPASKSVRQMQRLGPMPKVHGYDGKDLKFLRILNVVSKPTALLDRIENGTVSQEEMSALKYVLPAAHEELVTEVNRQVIATKAAGNFVPADKIVSLGILLGSAIDPTLEKPFIDAVQASFQPPKSPPAEAPPPDQTILGDTQDLQTPLQKALS